MKAQAQKRHLAPSLAPARGRARSAGKAGLPVAPDSAASAPLQAVLDRSPRVSAQAGLRAALDRSPRVAAETQRGAVLGTRAVQRRAIQGGSTSVVQRAMTRRGRRLVRGGATVAGAAGLGWALSGFGPLGLLAGATVGGLTGFFAPELVRWAGSGNIWNEVNHDDLRRRAWNTPQNLADQLARDSAAFRALRGNAARAVRAVHGRGLTYAAADDDIGGHTAAYGRGVVRIDEEQSTPAMSVQNLVFETANAAQSRFFDTLRADYASGALADNTLQHYGRLLGRDPLELGRLADEYLSADLKQRRAILQEWGEWNSLELARAAFAEIEPRFSSDTARWQWEEGFGQRLNARTFGEYYERFGSQHRASVERGGWGGKDKSS